MSLPEEPLLEAATLARTIAPRLCREDPLTGERCSWYHGLWLYLRALALITTPVHHAPFLRSAFGEVATSGARPRVLISGAADFSIFAHVLWACREHGASPAVTVVDLCETPLHMNRWYAARIEWPVATHCSNILDYTASGQFDAVCTHSFFGRFTDDERPRLMKAWHGLLRPGGIAIAVNRVRGGASAGRLGFRPAQAAAFRANVVRKAAAMRGRLDLEPEELGRLAADYAAHHHANPLRSEEEARRMFESGGLRVERLEEVAVGKAVDDAVSGPTTLEGARYACIVARKP